MAEQTEKRIFSYNGYTYTISTQWVADEPLTYTLRFDRSRGTPVVSQHLYDRTYVFEEAEYSHAFTEINPVLMRLHDFLEAAITRGEDAPDVLPDDWMTRR